jgi:hypothetical protein
MSVLPAPVRGLPLLLDPLDPLLVVSLLPPHAATPSAITPQQTVASMDLREITCLGLLRRVCRGQRPRGLEGPCYRAVADPLTSGESPQDAEDRNDSYSQARFGVETERP